MSKPWQRLLEALLPQDCLLCGEPGSADSLCSACRASLPQAPAACCPVCALPGPAAIACGECLKQPPHFDSTSAALMYAFPTDRLVQMLKYQHRLPVANLLADLMLARPPARIDVLIPVPLSHARLRERGFNQAQEIARLLGRSMDRPIDRETCRRVVNTPPQAALAWRERRRNMRNAFECVADYSGRHVVLIDDVMTTGATLDELARTLKLHGAASVTNWVAARTDRDRNSR